MTLNTSGAVRPINLASKQVGPPISVGNGPWGIAITPNGQTAYVTNNNPGSTVTPIDLANNTAGTPIQVGHNPYDIAITPDGKTAYVTDAGSNTVTPIDTATNQPGTPITVGTEPLSIAIAPAPPPGTRGKMVFQPLADLAARGVIVKLHVSVVCVAGDRGSVSVYLTEAVKGHAAVGPGTQKLTAACTGEVQVIPVTVVAHPEGFVFKPGSAYATGSLTACIPHGPCNGGARAKPKTITILR